MLKRAMIYIAIIGAFVGVLALNNAQVRELAAMEVHLQAQAKLISDMLLEQLDYEDKLNVRDATIADFITFTENLENEKSDLTRQLAAGTKRVYVKASCPPESSTADSSSPSSRNEAVAELAPDSRQYYLDFRSAYLREHRALIDLQNYVASTCK